MITASCILLGRHSASTVTSCWLIPNHWLTIRRFVQNIQEQLISQKNRGSHTSVLIATRDTHTPLTWSAIASPNIPIYSCARTDAFGNHTDTFCAHTVTYCTRSDIAPGTCCTRSDVFCTQTDHACSRTDMFTFVLCLCSCIVFFYCHVPCSARVRPQFYSGI